MLHKLWFRFSLLVILFVVLTGYTVRQPEPVHPFTQTAERIVTAFFAKTNDVTPVALPLQPGMRVYAQKFAVQNNELLAIARKRSRTCFPVMERMLQKHNLPTQLKYLAVVESNLEGNARSRVGAVGYWQLMPQTARELKLKVGGKWDERKNLHRSTAAVCLYLKDLYRYYGDWLLVIAAYNCGPGNVDKAIRKAGSRNYWALQRLLPAETRGHIKHFIGTHLYFEPQGSATVLTKKQAAVYAAALEAAEQNTVDSLVVSID